MGNELKAMTRQETDVIQAPRLVKLAVPGFKVEDQEPTYHGPYNGLEKNENVGIQKHPHDRHCVLWAQQDTFEHLRRGTGDNLRSGNFLHAAIVQVAGLSECSRVASVLTSATVSRTSLTISLAVIVTPVVYASQFLLVRQISLVGQVRTGTSKVSGRGRDLETSDLANDVVITGLKGKSCDRRRPRIACGLGPEGCRILGVIDRAR